MRALESGNAHSDEAIEAFIAERIESAQAALWRAELTRRILTLVIASILAGLAWTILDQWIYSPGISGRVLLASVLVLATIAYVCLRLWPVMHLRIGEEYAARALERDHAELGHSLSSYVSLRRQRADHPEGQLAQRVIHSVGSSAAAKLRQIDAPPSEATGLAAWWAATIALIAACAFYALASPKNSVQSIARLVVPVAALEAPKRVRITEVSPGDAETLAGRSIEIAATVDNLRDDEPVFFRWESSQSLTEPALTMDVESATPPQDQIRLLPSDASAGRNRYQASVPLSHHAQGRRRYRIIAGDANAGPFEISIRDTPVVQIREVIYQPPAYTGKPRHSRQSGAVRGIDGTNVRLLATVNRPIARAVIEFNPRKVGREVQATAGTRDMQVAADGSTIEFSFPLRQRGGAAIPLQDYRLRVFDDAGQFNADPIVYPIEIIEDLPPEINIVIPQEAIVDVPINGQQNFEIHAADVDFGLTEIEIEIHRGIDLIARSSLWKDPQGKQGNQVVEYRFRPSRIITVGGANRGGSGLNVGDEVEIIAIATDNRFDPSDNSIAPGVSKTQPVRMRITAAAEQSASDEEQQGDGEKGDGEKGDLEKGDLEKGDLEKGDLEKGDGEKGDGEKGGGEKGGGQQGAGEKGEQGEGQQGEGEGEMGKEGGEGASEGEGEGSEGGGGGGQEGEGDDASGEDSDGAESAEGGQSGNADDNPSGEKPAGDSRSSKDESGEAGGSGGAGGSSANQSDQPPQDDAEAFERIQEYLKQNEDAQRSPKDNQGAGNSGDTPNTNKSGESQGEGGDGEKSGQGSDQKGKSEPKSEGEADNSEADREPVGQSPEAAGENADGKAENTDPGQDGSGSDPGADVGAETREGDKSDGGGKSDNDQTGGDKPKDGQQSPGKPSGGGPAEDREPGESGQEAGEEAGQSKNDNNPRRGESGQAGDSSRGEESPAGDEAHPAEAADGASDPADGQDRGMGQQDADGAESSNGADNASQTDQMDGNQTTAGNPPPADGTPAGNGQQDQSSSDAGQEREQPQGKQDPNGAPGSKQDGGSKSESTTGEPSDQDGEDEQPGSSGQPGQSDGAGDSPEKPDPKGMESSQGGGGGQSAEGEGTGESVDDELPDPVDLEYTKAATDMVLDYLDETRADPDSNLLQRLQWTPRDLQRFRERWQNVKPIDDRPASSSSPDEIEEALRSLGMRPTVTTKSTRRDTADKLRSLRDGGNRRPAPAEVRDAFEAFRRGL